MKEISNLGLQRIIELADELDKKITDLGGRVLRPDGRELKFDDVCSLSNEVREIKQWADAKQENEE